MSQTENTTPKKKYYSFTKTMAREAIAELAGENKTVNVADLLELFASKGGIGNTTGATTTIVEDGEIVAKRCSYFGKYLDISEFGTVGKNEDGSPKYGYQSKPAQAVVRKVKSQVATMLADADTNLEEDGDVEAWKAVKAEAAELEATKVAFAGDLFDTELNDAYSFGQYS